MAKSGNARRVPRQPAVSNTIECETCSGDLAFLLTKERPDYEASSRHIRLVDLFAGGGGLTIGAAEAARRVGKGTTVALAVENADTAADVYALNFPDANLERTDVADIFDGVPGSPETSVRHVVRHQSGMS